MQEATDPPHVPQFSLGRRMRAAMEDAGINNIEMAAYLEVGANTVSNWLNGKTRPTALYLRQFALLTGVSYDWLAGDSPKDGGGIPTRRVQIRRPGRSSPRVKPLHRAVAAATTLAAAVVGAGGIAS